MSAMDKATRQSIDWLVLLESGEASDMDRQRLAAWLAEHPNHAAAWRKVGQALEHTVGKVRAHAAGDAGAVDALRRVVMQPPARRRFLRGALALAGVSVGGGLLLSHGRLLPDGLGGDVSSGTAERRRFALDDGSVVMLNARSGVDVMFSDTQRALYLRRGEMSVTAAGGTLPLTVRSHAAEVRHHGGQFMVRREATRTLVAALQGPLTIAPAPGRTGTALAEGDSAYVDHTGVWPSTGNAASLAAWQRGVLEVDNDSLGQVIDALRAYRHGVIRVDPSAARLRVLGIFPLDDTDRALQLLAAALPIRLHRYGPWLVLVEPNDPVDRSTA